MIPDRTFGVYRKALVEMLQDLPAVRVSGFLIPAAQVKLVRCRMDIPWNLATATPPIETIPLNTWLSEAWFTAAGTELVVIVLRNERQV